MSTSGASDTAPATGIPGGHATRTRPREWLKVGVAAAALLAVLLMPSQPGLPVHGQRVLAIVAMAVVLWATEAIPVALSSMLMLALLMMLGGFKSPSEALVGFSSPIPYFLIGSLAMAAATVKSGLAARLARYMIKRSGGSPARLTIQLLVAMPLMAFVMPSALNRGAMLMPAYEQVFRALSVRRGAPLSKVIMLILGLLNPLASSTLMTGGLAPMTTSTLLGGFTWLRWFSLMAVPYYVLIALGGAMIYLLHRPGRGWPGADEGTRRRGDAETRGTEDSGPRTQDPGLRTHKVESPDPQPTTPDSWPLSRDEKLTLAVVSTASLLWLTDFIHHWNAAVPALLAGMVLMLPGVGIMSWSEFEKKASWSTFLVVGASLSLAQALISTGAAAWFAGGLLGLIGGAAVSPPMVALFVILVTTLVHLGIPNMSACIALLLPMVAAFATATGSNPVAAGLIVGIVVDAVVLYPVQTATNLMVYDSGHFDAADVLRVGLGMLFLTSAVILLVAIPWWGLMGLRFGN